MKKKKDQFEFVSLSNKAVRDDLDKKVVDTYLKKVSGHSHNLEPLKFNGKQKDFIRKRVQHLPPAQMVVVNLIFWKNYSIDQAAEFLDCTVDHIKKLKESALMKLRYEFVDEFMRWKPSFNQCA